MAEYAGIPKPKELRILRQLMPRLNKNDRVLMSNVVFVVVLVYVLQNYLGLPCRHTSGHHVGGRSVRSTFY